MEKLEHKGKPAAVVGDAQVPAYVCRRAAGDHAVAVFVQVFRVCALDLRGIFAEGDYHGGVPFLQFHKSLQVVGNALGGVAEGFHKI